MAKRSALTKNPSATPVGRDMVYTGGSKDFNEVTGKYGSSGRATPAPTRLSPGVYRDSQGRLVGQGGRPLQQQPQRPPMQQQPPRPIEWSPQQPGQQGKGPARDVYTPLPQPPMGLKPLQPDYTGGTGDYNYMPSMPGNMGRGAYAMQPDTMYLGGSANFDESTGRYRSGYLPPDRGMGGDMGYIGMGKQPLNNMGGGMGTGLGNLAARGVNGGMGGGMGAGLGDLVAVGMRPQRPGLEQEARSRAEAIARGDSVSADFIPEREALVNRYLQEMGQRPSGNMGGNMGAGLGNLAAGGVGGGIGMVDPRTMVGPQYDPRSIAFPTNNPNGMGGVAGTGLGNLAAGGVGGGIGGISRRLGGLFGGGGDGGGKFGLADSIAAQVKARMAANAAGGMGQNFGNYNEQNIVPYNANRRR